MRRMVFIIAALVFTPFTYARGQVPVWELDQPVPLLQRGDRVRITFRCAVPPAGAKDSYVFCADAVGVLGALTTDSIVLRLEHEHRRFAISSPAVARLQVSQRQKTRLVRGVALGLGVGAAAGLLFGWGGTGGDSDKLSVPAVLAGAGLGLVGGAILGVRVRADEWQDVPLARSVIVLEVPVILRF